MINKILVTWFVVLITVSCMERSALEDQKINNQINLIIACVNGDIERVQYFADKLDTINYVSIKGDTPLNAAAYNGNLSIVKYLVENGASISLEDYNGLTATQIANDKGFKEIADYLKARVENESK